MFDYFAGLDSTTTSSQIIQNILLFFCSGYFFISCYHITSLSDREEQSEHLIIKCIAISYVFSLIVEMITINIPSIQRIHAIIASVILAIVLGLILGRFRRWKPIATIIDLLIGGDLREDVRVDIFEGVRKNMQIVATIRDRESKEVYQGQIERLSGSKSDPVLIMYCCERIEYSEKDRIVIKKRYNTDTRLLFLLSNLDRIEIQYIDLEKAKEDKKREV